jgi:hypothetical protein
MLCVSFADVNCPCTGGLVDTSGGPGRALGSDAPTLVDSLAQYQRVSELLERTTAGMERLATAPTFRK